MQASEIGFWATEESGDKITTYSLPYPSMYEMEEWFNECREHKWLWQKKKKKTVNNFL